MSAGGPGAPQGAEGKSRRRAPNRAPAAVGVRGASRRPVWSEGVPPDRNPGSAAAPRPQPSPGAVTGRPRAAAGAIAAI